MMFRSALVLLIVASSAIGAQSPRVMRYGVVEPTIRDSMSLQWVDSAGMHERGLCIAMWFATGRQHGRTILDAIRQVPPTADTAYVVMQITDPDTVYSTSPMSVHFRCPLGLPTIHVHTPTTCDDQNENCQMGGVNAYQCQPSRDDYISLVRSGAPFSVVWCGPHHYAFYFPSDARAEPLPKRHRGRAGS